MLLDRNIFYYVNIHNWIGQQALFHTDKICEVKHQYEKKTLILLFTVI